jgi:hypothetical protein
MSKDGHGWLIIGGLLIIAIGIATAITSRRHHDEHPATDTEPAAPPSD